MKINAAQHAAAPTSIATSNTLEQRNRRSRLRADLSAGALDKVEALAKARPSGRPLRSQARSWTNRSWQALKRLRIDKVAEPVPSKGPSSASTTSDAHFRRRTCHIQLAD